MAAYGRARQPLSTYRGVQSNGVIVRPGPEVGCNTIVLRLRQLGSVTLGKFLGSPFPHLQNEGPASNYCNGLLESQ